MSIKEHDAPSGRGICEKEVQMQAFDQDKMALNINSPESEFHSQCYLRNYPCSEVGCYISAFLLFKTLDLSSGH